MSTPAEDSGARPAGAAGSDGSDRRRQADRRSRPTPWIGRHWLRGQRRGGRRASERTGHYVDRYSAPEWLVVCAIVALCVADALLTLDVLAHGGEEANPLMAWLLEHGETTFAVVKTSFTLGACLLLLLRVRFRGVRQALLGMLLAYGLLMLWHADVQRQIADEELRQAVRAASTRVAAPSGPAAATRSGGERLP